MINKIAQFVADLVLVAVCALVVSVLVVVVAQLIEWATK